MGVKASDIYRDIMGKNKIKGHMQDSYVRNLRNKMTFLLKQVALGKMSDFKVGREVVIPDCDAPIVRNLIMASLDDHYPAVVDWFNGKLDPEDAQESLILFMAVKEPIMRAGITGETDSVTVDEWIATIKGILNVNMAQGTVNMKRRLEDFRSRTLVKDSTVGTGDVIVGDSEGGRRYAIKHESKRKKLPEGLLEQIVEELCLQEDYFSAMEQILDYMIADAEKKALPDITEYARWKSITEADNARDMVLTGNESMVSEYVPWLKKIGRFLRDNPDRASEIENEVGTEHLADFFE